MAAGAPGHAAGLASTRAGCLVAIATAGLLMSGVAQAVDFGHARLASKIGEPLVIVIPLGGLTTADIGTLSARAAPASEWSKAGLTPPVPLGTLRVTLTGDASSLAGRSLRIESPEAFPGPLADLLLQVRTATGEQRYQVSLVTAESRVAESIEGPRVSVPRGSSAAGPSSDVAGTRIRVRRGDTMFAIGRRHAVQGVSIYQLMLALQRANPQAFIQSNINLVRAGANLTMPSMAEMLAISDAEARRQFVAQTAAFMRLRGRQAANVPFASGNAASGGVSPPEATGAPQAAGQSTDVLRLSGAGAAADTRTAQGHALADAQGRVSQLQDNVKHLNEALQAQGEAARNAASQGAQALGQSLQDIANAVSEASQQAAAQASAAESAGAATGSAAGASAGAPGAASGASPAAQGATPGSSPGTPESTLGSSASTQGSTAGTRGPAVGPSGAVAAASGVGTSAGAGGSGASANNGGAGLPAGSGTGLGASTGAGGTAPGASAAGGAPGSPGATGSTAAPAGSAMPLGANLTTPAQQAKAHANAVEQERAASAETAGRVSWLQDHLLGVMTALLALIVAIIAWLLRRANAARDEAEGEPQITEAMVREKLQGIDLDLPRVDPGSPTTPQPDPGSSAPKT